MRIACVLVPDLAVQVVLQQRPDLVGKPVVVGGYPHERRAVAGASFEALATGISPGISLRQAAGLCPAATFLPLDAPLLSGAFASLLQVMESFSPAVEPAPPNAFYLDVTGIDLRTLGHSGPSGEQALLEALIRAVGRGVIYRARTQWAMGNGERRGSQPSRETMPETLPVGAQWMRPTPAPAPDTAIPHALPSSLLGGTCSLFPSRLPTANGRDISRPYPLPTASPLPSVGAGASPYVARVAATLVGTGGVRIVPPGEERATLAPASIALLPCSAEMQRRLRLFGLRTLGEFAALAFGPVQAQFGREGAHMWRLARGDDPRVLAVRRLPESIPYEKRFPSAVSSVDALQQIVARTLARLAPVLEQLFVSFRQVTLALALEDVSEWQRTWTLREPANHPEAANFVIAAELREAVLPAPVEALRLTLHDLCREVGHQESLFSLTARRATQLHEAVRQIEARCGRNLLQRVISLDPHSRIPERRRALVAFAPAVGQAVGSRGGRRAAGGAL